MKKIRDSFILGLLLAFIALFVPSGCTNSTLGISNPLVDQFTIKKINDVENVLQYEGSYKTLKVKIKKYDSVGQNKAKTIVDNRIYLLSSLFIDTDSPYPDLLSNAIRCSDEFKPKKIFYEPFDYYLLYATDRFTYGACSWDLLSYQSIMYFQTCGDDLYEIELFVPLGEDIRPYEEAITSTRCAA